MVVRFIGLFTGNPQLNASYGALIFNHCRLVSQPRTYSTSRGEFSIEFFYADVLRLSGAVGLGLEVTITPRMLVQHSL